MKIKWIRTDHEYAEQYTLVKEIDNTVKYLGVYINIRKNYINMIYKDQDIKLNLKDLIYYMNSPEEFYMEYVL